MVKIRLSRVGKKKQPSYRITVADSRAPRDGRNIEIIGVYNPRTEPETVRIQEDRALHWLGVGAQPTDAVARLLEKLGTLARFERLKAGESLDVLLAEAEAEVEARATVSPKTRRKPAKRQVAKVEEQVKAQTEEQEEAETPDEVTEEEVSAEAEEELAEADADVEPEEEPSAEVSEQEEEETEE